MGIEHEIIKHLDLCAVLMSDPLILRNHPDIVANQFDAAKASIEALCVFLRPKAKDHCDCHVKGWMDVSIIRNGIGHLVTKLLSTHMGVVRMEKFPCIIEKNWKSVSSFNPSDNFIIREIKESNCMGSIILLYYYLYWHLLLIRMNQRIDPTYFSKSQLDIDWLIENLPKSHAFLEFRSLGNTFRADHGEGLKEVANKITALLGTQATNPFMFGMINAVQNPGQKRQTMLVSAYRRALDTNLGANNVVDTYMEFPTAICDKPSFYIFNTITMDTILRGMTLMGGMASVYDRTNPIQKWKDMHQPIQVVSDTPEGKMKLNGKLATILSNKPYAAKTEEFDANGIQACIYDHCSAALMMDICRSFQKLAELVGSLAGPDSDEMIYKYMKSFLRNISGHSVEALGLVRVLSSIDESKINALNETERQFTDKDDSMSPHTTKAAEAFQTGTGTTKLWLDEFKHLYPSRLPGVSEDINRRCFLLDLGIEKDVCASTEKWIELVQSELIQYEDDTEKVPFCTAYALIIIASFMRNSWMVTHGLNSVKPLMEKIIYAPGFQNIPMTYEAEQTLYSAKNKNATAALHDTTFIEFAQIAEDETMEILKNPSDRTRKENDKTVAIIQKKKEALYSYTGKNIISFPDIYDCVKSQQQTLAALAKASTEFYRYPALAWPVGKFGDNNVHVFKKVDQRSRPGRVSGGYHGTNGPVDDDSGYRNMLGQNTKPLENANRFAEFAERVLQPPLKQDNSEIQAEL